MPHDFPGIVAPGHLYLSAELRKRLHLGDWAWRKMRRGGLQTVRVGRQAFVLGDDVIAFFQNEARSAGGPHAP